MKKYIVILLGFVSAAFGQGCATNKDTVLLVPKTQPVPTVKEVVVQAQPVRQVEVHVVKPRKLCVIPKDHLSQENDFLPKPCPDKSRYSNFGRKEISDSQSSQSTATPYFDYNTGRWEVLKNTSMYKSHTERPVYNPPVYSGYYYGVQPGVAYPSGTTGGGVTFGYSAPSYGGGSYYVRPNTYYVRP